MTHVNPNPRRVSMTADKAKAAAVVSALTTIATGVALLVPENETVKLVSALAVLLLGAVGNVIAVFLTPNEVKQDDSTDAS